MTIMCHLRASVDDAFRASAMANPIVPLAPVRRHTFDVVMVSVVNCCGCVIGSKLQHKQATSKHNTSCEFQSKCKIAEQSSYVLVLADT